MHVALLVALALPQRTLPLSVGIDLGTSNSCVAWTRADGTRELVPRRDGGGLLTPSVCVVDGAGAPALCAPDAAPPRGAGIIRAWKRAVGLDAATAKWRLEDATRRRLRLDDGAGDADGWIGAAVPLEGGGAARARPEACAAAVIASLLDDCEAHCGARPDRAVVGVPACFLPSQREATERAAASCGLAKVQTANEPELAAHAHGVGAGGGDALALVFDLGGGTLDCSLVDVGGETRTMEVVATAGDLNLGGTDFTAALARAENIDEAEAERVKIALTTRKVAATAAGANVTRSRLEACLDPLLERCADAAREAAYLGDARLKGDAELMGSDAGRASTRAKRRKAERADRAALEDLKKRAPGVRVTPPPGARDVDDVVLVGAATKMPCVQRALSRLTALSISRRVNPDHAVALGAAIRAEMNDAEVADDDAFVVVDAFKAEVLRHFYGGAADDDDDDDDDEVVVEVDDAEFARLLALAEADDDEDG